MEIPDSYQPATCVANPIEVREVRYAVGVFHAADLGDSVGMIDGPHPDIMELINRVPGSPNAHLFRFDEFGVEDCVMRWSAADQMWSKTGECPATFMFRQALVSKSTQEIVHMFGHALPVSEVMKYQGSVDFVHVDLVIVPFSIAQPCPQDVRAIYDNNRSIWVYPS